MPQDNHQFTNYSAPWDKLLPIGLRILVWGVFFSILALLSSFFVLVFLTFVFAYLQSSAVNFFTNHSNKRRGIMVVLIGLLFLSLIIAISFFVAPRVYHQAADFAKEFSIYVQRLDHELLDFSQRYPVLLEAIPELQKLEQAKVDHDDKAWRFADSPTAAVFEMIIGFGESKTAGDVTHVQSALNQLANIGGKALVMISTFLLALLFSFLIVLDWPRLKKNVQELENTKLRFIYIEMADSIHEFGRVLGSAIQAQFYIAIINTLLTAVGLYFLGMGEQVAFLSVIVFLFSFIPIVGVIISSVPICLVALKAGGLYLVFLSLLFITVIHMIEGYILNPNIYGVKMRINPVIVLIILTIGGKLFHIWGLILGVPVSTYIFGYAIRYDKNSL